MAMKYHEYFCKKCQVQFADSTDIHALCGLQAQRVFTSKFNKTCVVCIKPIQVGDKFTWDRRRDNTPMHPICLALYNPAVHAAGHKEALKDTEPEESREDLKDAEPTKTEIELPEVTPDPTPIPSQSSDPLIGMLVKYLEPHLKAKVDLSQVRSEVDSRVKSAVESAATTLRAEFNKSVTVIVKHTELSEIKLECTHYLFPKILQHLIDGDNVCLWGPPGSGKTTIAQQATEEALKMAFSHISLDIQAPRSLLMGFIDATGRYNRTEYRERYEHGGKFLIDEVFNGSPNLFTSLNTSLANGSCAFPDSIVRRHETFSCIACDNTAGLGGSLHHKDRREADAAFRERFVFVFVGYDEDMERRVTMGINPKADSWLRWIRDVRKYVDSNKIRLIVSPRASFVGAKKLLHGHFDVAEIAESVLWKGLDKDTVNKIVAAAPYLRY